MKQKETKEGIIHIHRHDAIYQIAIETPLVISIMFVLICLSFGGMNAQAQEAQQPEEHHNTQSQLGRIEGIVVEDSTGSALELATVRLFKTSDSSLVTGSMTDDTGSFMLDDIAPGQYFLRVSFVGYEVLQTENFAVQGDPVALGVLRIALNPLLGPTIEVTGERPTLNYGIDRKVYNVDQDILSQSGSASDVLQNVPSVTVDVDGNISLRGSDNVTIFVNGKPSLLMRKNSATVLQQMPANTIERIEVITNPSAKYKPDGTGGIINIVLKKEKRAGFNGTTTANVGNQSRYNGNLTVNYKPGEANLYGSYGFRKTNHPRVATTHRISFDSLGDAHSYYDYGSSASSKPLSHMANIGLDGPLGENNQLSVSGDYFYRDSYHTQDSKTTISDSIGQTVSRFMTDGTNDEYESEYEINSSLEHALGDEDRSLNLECNVSGYDEKEDNHYRDDFVIPSESSNMTRNLIRKGGHLIELYAECAYPLNEQTEIEAGYVGEFLYDDIRYLGETYDTVQPGWFTDPNKTDEFHFNQTIHSIYGTISHSWDHIGLLAGLRAEQTLITSRLITIDTVVPND